MAFASQPMARSTSYAWIGNKRAVAAVRANADHRAENLRAIVDDLRTQGITSVRALAAALNERGTHRETATPCCPGYAAPH